jgi:hypothetical protein
VVSAVLLDGEKTADLLPMRINASATRAVPESFAKFLIIARGRKMATSPRIIHWIGMNVLQSVTASTKACRFWAIKMVYAAYQLRLKSIVIASLPHTNPIWDTVRETRIEIRMYFPYKAPPISEDLSFVMMTGVPESLPPKLPGTTM